MFEIVVKIEPVPRADRAMGVVPLHLRLGGITTPRKIEPTV
jgi:hypothetical protein